MCEKHREDFLMQKENVPDTLRRLPNAQSGPGRIHSNDFLMLKENIVKWPVRDTFQRPALCNARDTRALRRLPNAQLLPVRTTTLNDIDYWEHCHYVVVVGQSVGSISSKTLAYACLCTLELCTASMIATSQLQ